MSDNVSPRVFAPGLLTQGFTPPVPLSSFKAIAFDMDSTLINIECIDEIADAVGKKAEVAAITEAAMRGEITDFKDSLRRRVAYHGINDRVRNSGVRRTVARGGGRARHSSERNPGGRNPGGHSDWRAGSERGK